MREEEEEEEETDMIQRTEKTLAPLHLNHGFATGQNFLPRASHALR